MPYDLEKHPRIQFPKTERELAHYCIRRLADVPEVEYPVWFIQGQTESASEWVRWNGYKFETIPQRAILAVVNECIEEIVLDYSKNYSEDDTLKYERKSLKNSTAIAATNILSGHLTQPISMLNSNTDYFTIRNGRIVVNPELPEFGTFIEHDRSIINTQCGGNEDYPLEYNPKATCPKWIDNLRMVWENDEELIRYFQMLCGYWMTADCGQEAFYVFWGKGRNGKSKIVETLMTLYGDYATPISTSLVTEGWNEHGTENRFEMTQLPNARFIWVDETDPGMKLREKVVKQITDGARVSTDKKFSDKFFKFKIRGKLLFTTNYLPIIPPESYALKERNRPVKFPLTIPRQNRIENFGKILLEELPGILNWSIDGLRMWGKYRKRGGDVKIPIPKAIVDFTAEYEFTCDPTGEFRRDCCETGELYSVKLKDLYDEYEKWCTANGVKKPLGKIKFNNVIELNFVKKRGKHEEYWLGIGLLNDPKCEFDFDKPIQEVSNNGNGQPLKQEPLTVPHPETPSEPELDYGEEDDKQPF